MVANVDRVVDVDEDGLWIDAHGVVISESDCNGIPCGIWAELRLIEWPTYNRKSLSY